MLWTLAWSWILLIFPIFHLLLTFPDGRLLSPRWRLAVALEVAMVSIFLGFTAFAQDLGVLVEDERAWTIANPIGFLPNSMFDDSLGVAWEIGLVAITIASAAAVVLRFRRGSTIERQQLKWPLLAVILFGAVYAGATLNPDLVGGGSVLFGPSLAGIPISVAIAVLRYRLYAIDHLISRTVSWAAITAILVAVFVAGVLGLQFALAGVTETPTFAVAASTLLAFGLFQPHPPACPARRRSAVRSRSHRRRTDRPRVRCSPPGRSRHRHHRRGPPYDRRPVGAAVDPGHLAEGNAEVTRISGALPAFRTSRPIAVLLLALSMAMVAFAMASLVLPGGDALPDRPDVLTVVVAACVMLSYPLVGAILAIRRPGNPLGWLLLVLGLGFTIAFFSTDYVGRAVVSGWSLPGVVLVAWISNWGFAVDMALGFTWIPLLFPTGHLPGRRWRLIAWAIVITMVLGIAASALRPGRLDAGLGTLPNPFGIDALAGILGLVQTLYFPAIAALGVICVGSLFVRFRRSGAVERQQVKWFLLANAAFLVTLVVAFATFNDAAFMLALVAAAGIPIAAGIAILRYRLWDIDRIVSRTVSWAVITAVLVAVFVGGVLGLQAVLAQVTEAPTLAVAVSTLLAFGLFQPLRRRVQRVVDRRFDRARIDAERIAQGFGARLRDEIAIDAIAADLQTTIDGSVRPSAQGLWLRVPGGGRAASGS